MDIEIVLKAVEFAMKGKTADKPCTIKISPCINDEPELSRILKGTYLHGKLEEKYGYDIFTFESKLDEKSGRHILIEENTGEPLVFFLWDRHKADTFYDKMGLLVYAKDRKSMEYANKCFEEKEVCL